MNSNIGKKTRIGRRGANGQLDDNDDEYFVSDPQGFRHEKHFGQNDANIDQVAFASQDVNPNQTQAKNAQFSEFYEGN